MAGLWPPCWWEEHGAQPEPWNGCADTWAALSDSSSRGATLLTFTRRSPLFLFCFVSACEENELASQYGTALRGSGSWEETFTSAPCRTGKKAGILLFSTLQPLPPPPADKQGAKVGQAWGGGHSFCSDVALARPGDGAAGCGGVPGPARVGRAPCSHLFPTPQSVTHANHMKFSTREYLHHGDR